MLSNLIIITKWEASGNVSFVIFPVVLIFILNSSPWDTIHLRNEKTKAKGMVSVFYLHIQLRTTQFPSLPEIPSYNFILLQHIHWWLIWQPLTAARMILLKFLSRPTKHRHVLYLSSFSFPLLSGHVIDGISWAMQCLLQEASDSKSLLLKHRWLCVSTSNTWCHLAPFGFFESSVCCVQQHPRR